MASVRELIILGAGPHAEEMADIVEQVNRAAPCWRLCGFALPEPPEPARRELLGLPVLGREEAQRRYPEAFFVPEFGNPVDGVPSERLVSLVAPSATVSSSASLGPGCVIYPGCFVGAHASLGWQVFMLAGCVVNHDDHLGDRVTLCSGVALAGQVEVEDDAYLGQACSVRQLLRIGRRSLVGMGSVVVDDVPPDVVVAGNPARWLRDR